MSYDKALKQLKNKYSNKSIHTQITDNYTMITYPSAYYLELIDLIIEYAENES